VSARCVRGADVRVFASHDQLLCLWHRRWLGSEDLKSPTNATYPNPLWLCSNPMKAAAIAAKAAEPVTRITFVKAGTPADDALAMLADKVNRLTAGMMADLARETTNIDALIFDGASAQESEVEPRTATGQGD
jgi:hypothetical protein